MFLPNEPTDPHTLLSSSLTEDQRRLLELSLRNGGDPAPWVSVIKLTDSLNRFKVETGSVIKDLADSIDPERIERAENAARSTQRAWKSAKKHAWAAILALGGALGTIVVTTIKAADSHGVDSQRMLQLERDAERHERVIEQLRDLCTRQLHSSLDPAGSLFLATPLVASLRGASDDLATP